MELALPLEVLLEKQDKSAINDDRRLHEGVSRVALVLTDGNSNCDTSVAAEPTQILHVSKASIFAVGIGSYINNVELQTIATAKNYVMHVNNYHELTTQLSTTLPFKHVEYQLLLVPNVKVETTVSSDTYRYYQLDTNRIASNQEE